MVNIHTSWQIVLFHYSIYLLIIHCIFCLLSFLELHNMDSHMLFSIDLLIYKLNLIQSQLFSHSFHYPSIDSLVLSLYVLFPVDAYFQSHLSIKSRFNMIPIQLISCFSLCVRIVPHSLQIPLSSIDLN